MFRSVVSITALSIALCTLGLHACTRQPSRVYPRGDFQLDASYFRTDARTPPDATIDPCRPGAVPVGSLCTSNVQCSDGCFCNGVETCESGRCVAAASPCTDAFSCTEESCVEEVDTCVSAPVHARCQDTTVCNGTELCDPQNPISSRTTGCRAGLRPNCSDENSCTIDSCDATRGCVTSLRDLDGDTFVTSECGGVDCNDDNAAVFPGQREVCANDIDDDCDYIRDYHDTDCTAANDTCETAELLPGAGTYARTLRGLLPDTRLTCFTRAYDAFFRFRLDETKTVVASVSGAVVALAVRTLAGCDVASDLQCRSLPPRLTFPALAPGDYVIIVSSSEPERNFDLTLEMSDPAEFRQADTCASNTVTVTGSTLLSGDYAGISDDYSIPCGETPIGGARDLVFALNITAPTDVRVIPETPSVLGLAAFRIRVTADCDSTGELVCSAPAFSTALPGLFMRNVQPGRYFVIAEPTFLVADDSRWMVQTEMRPVRAVASGDTCDNPIDISNGAPVTVAFSSFDRDFSMRCFSEGPNLADAFVAVTTTTAGDVRLRVGPTGSTEDVVAHIATACTANTRSDCVAATSTDRVLTFPALGSGRHVFRLIAPSTTTVQYLR